MEATLSTRHALRAYVEHCYRSPTTQRHAHEKRAGDRCPFSPEIDRICGCRTIFSLPLDSSFAFALSRAAVALKGELPVSGKDANPVPKNTGNPRLPHAIDNPPFRGLTLRIGSPLR
ncbi:hypothetical protein MTO96_033949 [Rhipicephalus appendiculatus]